MPQMKKEEPQAIGPFSALSTQTQKRLQWGALKVQLNDEVGMKVQKKVQREESEVFYFYYPVHQLEHKNKG